MSEKIIGMTKKEVFETMSRISREWLSGKTGSMLVFTIGSVGLDNPMVPYLDFKGQAAPVAFALQQVGYHWGAAIISVGAICGLTSVLLVMHFIFINSL